MIKVPKAAIQEDDDEGNAIAPEVGDVVKMGGVKAKVVAVDGDSCDLEVQSINGHECSECDTPDPKDDGDEKEPDEKSLMAKAEAHDKRMGRV